MQAVQAVSPVPLDCHLMIESPERRAPGYAEAAARNVTVHASRSRSFASKQSATG